MEKFRLEKISHFFLTSFGVQTYVFDFFLQITVCLFQIDFLQMIDVVEIQLSQELHHVAASCFKIIDNSFYLLSV